MTNYSKGGRGKKAPYKTVHYRIPQPIKPTVELLAEQYRELVAMGRDIESQEMLERVQGVVESSQIKALKIGTKFNETELKQVIDILQEALRLKANAGGKIKEQIRIVLGILKI